MGRGEKFCSTGSEFLKLESVRRTFHYYLLFIYLGLICWHQRPDFAGIGHPNGYPSGQMVLCFYSVSLGYTLGTLLGGRLLDRMRGHPVLGVGQLVSALLLVFYGHSLVLGVITGNSVER